MDRLKFRVWNNALNAYDMDDHYLNEDGELSCKGDYVVEQCTGLKDKNGKLIYEGDIIKTKEFGKSSSYSNFNDFDYFEVVFHTGAFWINKNNVREFLMMRHEVFEIIGNVHDNKENLK